VWFMERLEVQGPRALFANVGTGVE
jgi:hypothetical protein